MTGLIRLIIRLGEASMTPTCSRMHDFVIPFAFKVAVCQYFFMAQVLTVRDAKTWSWGDFVRNPWNLIAVPLALIVLVNLTGRFFERVPLIDRVTQEYATWMPWVFNLAPTHIPSGWNDYIVLWCVAFIITNAGYYRRRDKLFITDLLSLGLFRSVEQGDPQLSKNWQVKIDDLAAFVTGCSLIVVIALLPAYFFLKFMSFFISFHTNAIVAYARWPVLVAVVVGSGCFIAWRWILGIALLFALLVFGNEAYLHLFATTELLGGFSHNLFSL